MVHHTAIVSGGNTGIGAAIARGLLAEGYDVISLSRRKPDWSHPKLSSREVDLLDATATRQAATELGLELFSSSPGSSVTAIRPPAGIDSGVIVKEFRTRFNAVIANGQGSMKGQIFRIAHLGYYDYLDTIAAIGALEQVLAEMGRPIELGAGLKAAQQVYAEATQPAMAAR